MSDKPKAPETPAALRRRALARRARAELTADPARVLTISELARRCQTSPTVLKEAFRDEFGMPVYEWHRRWRMIRAAKLLIQTDLAVGEVARAVGYANSSKFARAFADCLHMNPSVWRTRYRKR